MKAAVAVRAPVVAKTRAPTPRTVRVSQPGSAHERQADDLAERLLAMRGQTFAGGPLSVPPPTSRPAGVEMPLPASIRRVLAGSGTPLARGLRREMEMHFGHDFSRVRVFSGSEAATSAREIGANAFAIGNDIVFGANRFAPQTRDGLRLLAHELAHVMQGAGDSVLFRDDTGLKPASTAKADDEEPIAYPVKIPAGVVSRAELERYAETLIFGRSVNFTWTPQGTATAEKLKEPGKFVGESVTFSVKPSELFKHGVPRVSKAEQEAAHNEYRMLDADERAEIDRRYFESIGDKTATSITLGDIAKSEIWRGFERQFLDERRRLDLLPEYAREVLGQPWEVRPRNYQAAMPIVDRLLGMSADDVKDFRSITTFMPGNLKELAAAFEKYDASKARYEKAKDSREHIVQRLYGTEDIYRQIQEGGKRSNALMEQAKKARARDTAASGAGTRHEWEPLEKRARDIFAEETRVLNETLKAHHFESVVHYRAALDRLESAFLNDAVEMVMALLDRFEHRLRVAADQYSDDAMVDDLLDQVSKSGATPLAWQAGQLTLEAEIIEGRRQRSTLDVSRLSDRDRLPEAKLKRARAAVLTSQANASLGKVQGHPLLLDDEFPRRDVYSGDRDRAKKAILKHIAKRIGDIETVREDLRSSPKMIYKLPRVMAVALQRQDIEKGSFAYQIVTERQAAYLKQGRIKQLVLAIVAIALTILSMGTGAWATAAAFGAFALSAYEAIELIREYEKMSKYAGLGFADEPSLVWVVVAVAGAGLDLGTVIGKLRVIKPALLEFSKDTAKFAKLAEAAERLPGELRDVVLKAAIAERQAAEALNRALGAVSGGMGSGFGMLKAVPAIAEWLFRKGISKYRSFKAFLKEAEAAKLFGKAGLSGKELTEAKAAFDNARELARQVSSHGKALRLTDNEIASFLAKMQEDATLTLDSVRKAMSDAAAAKPKSPVRALTDETAKATTKAKKRGPLDLDARDRAASRFSKADEDITRHGRAVEAERFAEHDARKELLRLNESPRAVPASMKSDIERIEKIKSLDERIEALEQFKRSSGKVSDEEQLFLNWRSDTWRLQKEAEDAAGTVSHLRGQVADAKTRKAVAAAELREESKDLIALMRKDGPNYKKMGDVKVDQAMFEDHWKGLVGKKPRLATDHLVSLDRITKLPELDELISLYTRASPAVKLEIKTALEGLGDIEKNLMRLSHDFNSGVKNSQSWEAIKYEVAAKRGGYTIPEVNAARTAEADALKEILGKIDTLTKEFKKKVP